MYHPGLEEVQKLRGQGNIVPVYREINADLETPVSAYLKAVRGDYSFLLESVEGGEHLARYSFIGTEPSSIVQTGKDNPVDPLVETGRRLEQYRPVPVPDLPRFCGGVVGYLGYETSGYYEKLPSSSNNPLDLPESVLMLIDTLLVFDHLTHKIKIITNVPLIGDIEGAYRNATQKIDAMVKRLEGNVPDKALLKTIAKKPEAADTSSNISREDFKAAVSKAKEYISAGDVIQVVLSQRFFRQTECSPFAIYRALRSVNPSPYMYYLNLGDFQIVGASPELLVRVEDRIVSNHPIAGTRPRSKDNNEDMRLEKELRNDEKERAEHIMLVDLSRNDVGKVSVPGTVEITQLMDVERYSHVMHLVSHVQGKLRDDSNPLDALRACFPAGTVSGAPKIRAMEIIAELEPDKRGPYAGAVGYFDFSGNLDTAIGIRTIIVKDKVAHIQAGAGIVYDSVPEQEYQECINKAKAMITAIEQAEEADYAAVNR